jgi:hypothetical protein
MKTPFLASSKCLYKCSRLKSLAFIPFLFMKSKASFAYFEAAFFDSSFAV